MFQIEITCDADKTIKLLDNFDIGTKTFEEPLIQTAEYMQIQALLNFQTEGETMGERWPPLGPPEHTQLTLLLYTYISTTYGETATRR